MAAPQARQKLAVASGLDRVTATFDQSTAVDNTYTLFAVVMFSGVTADIVSNSWGATLLSGSANNGSANFLGAYKMRGDGTTNSITIVLAGARTAFKVVLLAIPGWKSDNVDSARGVSLSGMQVPGLAPTTPTQGANRVAIAGLSANGSFGTVSGTWSGGFESAHEPTERFMVATAAVPVAGSTPTTTSPSWTSDRGLRAAMWVIEGAAATGAPDTIPPTVAITSPANDSTVRGTIDLTATATDDSGAPPTVRFLMGSTVLGTASLVNGTYTLAGIDTTQVENAAYVLRAEATDGSGNVSSVEHTIIVNNSSAPVSTPPGLYLGGKALALPPGVVRMYYGLSRVLGSDPTLPPDTGGGGGGTDPDPDPGGGTVTPPPTGVPTRLASFGPTGTNYLSRTPWVGLPNSAYESSGGTSVEVDCTWGAIQTALVNAFNHPNKDGMFRVLVRPGELPGFGGGSGSTAVLQNLGALGRKWRVLVAPRDGVFSVTFDNSFRFLNMKGVSFIGFSPAGPNHQEVDGGIDDLDPVTGKYIPNTSPNAKSAIGINISNVADFGFGWGQATHWNLSANNGGNIDGLDLAELIAPWNAVSNTDRSSGRNADGGYMRNVTMAGLWVGPRWRNDRGAHLDTFQASGNSARFENFTFLNDYFNGVSNAVLIGVGDGVEPVNSMSNPYIDHCALVGGLQAGNHMYPFKGNVPMQANQPQAIPMETGPVALNGKPYRPRVRDSLISGKTVWTFASCENTKFRNSDVPAPLSGTPIIEPGLFTTRESFESYGIMKIPSVQDMRNMWRW